MKHLCRSSALALLLAGALTACAGDIMAPESPPPVQTAQLDPASDATPLLGGVRRLIRSAVDSLLGAVVRLEPLQSPTVVEQWVGPEGGVLRGAGVELRIPAGALAQRTNITLIVPAGSYVEAAFLPHGLVFRTPATLRFDMSGTSLGRSSDDSVVGTYFKEDIVDGAIRAEEVFPASLRQGVVEFSIEHFSRYAPAYGRGYTPAGG